MNLRISQRSNNSGINRSDFVKRKSEQSVKQHFIHNLNLKLFLKISLCFFTFILRVHHIIPKNCVFYKKIKDKRELRGYHYEEGAEVYDIISGIGHEYSPIRNDVCMEHLYILFISSLDESDLQTNKVFVDSIVKRLL